MLFIWEWDLALIYYPQAYDSLHVAMPYILVWYVMQWCDVVNFIDIHNSEDYECIDYVNP